MVETTGPPGRVDAYLSAIHGNAVKLDGDTTRYQFRHVLRGPGLFYIDWFDHTAALEYRADPLTMLAVMRIRRGVRTDLLRDDRCGPGDLVIPAQPGQACHARLEDSARTSVLLQPHVVADVARNRPDDQLGPLAFSSLHPVSPVDAAAWVRAVNYLTTSLQEHPEAMAQPLLVGAAARLLAATLLVTFPNTWATSEPTCQDRVDATPAALHRAVAFIETNADCDITAVDIARAACVTVRAVQLAFRHHLDTTPMAYLRRVRLEHAHQELSAAGPGDATTVSEVAARWGFARPHRFAARYRQAYGQPPSLALRT
jgi:AraC-like DNA-binding protein